MIIKNNPEKNYTKISNTFLLDTSLSLECRMVGILLMSFPNHWKVNISHLAQTLGKGETTIRKAIKELVASGRLIVSQLRENGGKFSNNLVYEFVGEVREEVLAEAEAENLKELKIQGKKSFENAENKENQPFDKNTDSGEYEDILKLKNINKTKIYLTRETKKQLLLDLCFKKPLKTFEIPKDFNQNEKESILQFFSYRAENRKIPFSTKEAIVKKLLGFKASGEDISAIIHQSIECGWVGLFPLRKQHKRQSKQESNTPQNRENPLQRELLSALKQENLEFARLKEDCNYFITHPQLGRVAIYKKNGVLNFSQSRIRETYNALCNQA